MVLLANKINKKKKTHGLCKKYYQILFKSGKLLSVDIPFFHLPPHISSYMCQRSSTHVRTCGDQTKDLTPCPMWQIWHPAFKKDLYVESNATRNIHSFCLNILFFIFLYCVIFHIDIWWVFPGTSTIGKRSIYEK